MNKKTMQAVMLSAEGQIELREVPIPVPAEGEVLVKVRAATICGTDVKIFRRGHPKFPPPFVFGHEFGGEIQKKSYEHAVSITLKNGIFVQYGESFKDLAGKYEAEIQAIKDKEVERIIRDSH